MHWLEAIDRWLERGEIAFLCVLLAVLVTGFVVAATKHVVRSPGSSIVRSATIVGVYLAGGLLMGISTLPATSEISIVLFAILAALLTPQIAVHLPVLDDYATHFLHLGGFYQANWNHYTAFRSLNIASKTICRFMPGVYRFFGGDGQAADFVERMRTHAGRLHGSIWRSLFVAGFLGHALDTASTASRLSAGEGFPWWVYAGGLAMSFLQFAIGTAVLAAIIVDVLDERVVATIEDQPPSGLRAWRARLAGTRPTLALVTLTVLALTALWVNHQRDDIAAVADLVGIHLPRRATPGGDQGSSSQQPSTPDVAPATSRCGSRDSRPPALQASVWSQYACMSEAVAGSRWPRCFERAAYSSVRGTGCPGEERCCPP